MFVLGEAAPRMNDSVPAFTNGENLGRDRGERDSE